MFPAITPTKSTKSKGTIFYIEQVFFISKTHLWLVFLCQKNLRFVSSRSVDQIPVFPVQFYQVLFSLLFTQFNCCCLHEKTESRENIHFQSTESYRKKFTKSRVKIRPRGQRLIESTVKRRSREDSDLQSRHSTIK